jgi:predicted GNAT superfamily acetyltransferase
MIVEYKELTTRDDFDQCIELQKAIFGFSDTDLISPLFLKLISRKYPPVGISLGVFLRVNDKSELIGFVIGFASFLERSVYTIIMGIKPAYQNKIYGYKLASKYIEEVSKRNIDRIYCMYDPLEIDIARLYLISLGFIGIKYEIQAFDYSDLAINEKVPVDSLLIYLDINSKKATNRINGIQNKNLSDPVSLFPIATIDSMPLLPTVLVQIPDQFVKLSESDVKRATELRMENRAILNEYINNKNYIVSNCISKKTENTRKTYYLLEKQ